VPYQAIRKPEHVHGLAVAAVEWLADLIKAVAEQHRRWSPLSFSPPTPLPAMG